MPTRRLTCGFVNRLDTYGTLSDTTRGMEARARYLAIGRGLFLSLLVFVITLLQLSNSTYSFVYKNQVLNLKLYDHMEIRDWTEFECYVELITKESTWNYKARNGSHYGLGQVRSEWYGSLSPRKQIKAHLRYIDHRYDGSPCKALRHFYRKGWH